MSQLCGRGAALRIQLVAAKDAPTYPTVHRATPTLKHDLVQVSTLLLLRNPAMYSFLLFLFFPDALEIEGVVLSGRHPTRTKECVELLLVHWRAEPIWCVHCVEKNSCS